MSLESEIKFKQIKDHLSSLTDRELIMCLIHSAITFGSAQVLMNQPIERDAYKDMATYKQELISRLEYSDTPKHLKMEGDKRNADERFTASTED